MKRVCSILLMVLLLPNVPILAQDDRRVEFRGVIESLPDSGLIGVWTVAGRRVRVDEATRINQEDGRVAVGVLVEVHGVFVRNASILATEIEVKTGTGEERIEFRGTIDGLPDSGLVGVWTVSGRRVHVTESTRIDQEQGAARVGAFVEVHGFVRSDAAIVATRIKVKDESPGRRGEFRGIIETLPDGGLIGVWSVSGRRVVVTDETRINQEHGRAVVGAFVEVHGFIQDGEQFTATEIEVKSGPGDGDRGSYVEFRGTIEALPAGGLLGDWTIDGRTVHVTERTRINQEHGAAAVGAFVEIKGWSQSDGTVLAAEIEVKADRESGRELAFRGVIESLPGSGLLGDWIVGGRTVHVTEATAIRQKRRLPEIGAVVQVFGIELADRSINATAIKVKR